MTTIGQLGVPLLHLCSAPGLIYLNLYFIHHAYEEWQAQRLIGISTSDAVLATGLLLTNQWGAEALFAMLFFASSKLQAQTETRLAHILPAVEADSDSVNQIRIAGDAADGDATGRVPGVLVSGTPAWQRWIDQGTLPFLTLSLVSVPLLGINHALAILLANFGYDYRLMAPLSTLSYLRVSADQGILLQSGHALEQLLQLDLLVLDGQWDATMVATIQAMTTITIISPALVAPETIYADDAAVDLATLIAQHQARGEVVAYLGCDVVNEMAAAQADIFISSDPSLHPDADLLLVGDPMEKLQRTLAMLPDIAANRQRGLYLAIVPSLINLTGIYFLHFGVISALLVDYGGSIAGIFNALLPRLEHWPEKDNELDGMVSTGG